MIVKSAYWACGLGVLKFDSPDDVKKVLEIYGATDTSVVVQPFVGNPKFCDFRIIAIEGKVKYVVKWAAPEDSFNTVSSDIKGVFIKLPEEIKADVQKVIDKINLPYVAMDYIFDGKEFYFSEMELDGFVPGLWDKVCYDISFSRL